jgi:hypothetical protein
MSFVRGHLRPINLLIATAISLLVLALPTAVGAAAPVSPTMARPLTTVTRTPNHPCAHDPNKTCYTIITRTVDAHPVFPKPAGIAQLGTQAHACGTFSLRHSVQWSDFDFPTGLPVDLMRLDATDGYDGCGNSFTYTINGHSCSQYVQGLQCDGQAAGGNYHDPNHSFWNTDWMNQDASEFIGPTRIASWTVYLRLWNDGWGNTDSGVSCVGSCFGGRV